MPANLDDLQRVPLFQGLTDRALDALAALASETTFGLGQVITAEGDEGVAFYLLLAGRASVARHGRLIKTLGPGDFFGEISLVDGRPRTATVVAETEVRAIEIRREEFVRLMDRFGAVRLGIVMALTERVRSDERELV